MLRRYSFADLVHPEDIGTLLRTSAEGGRAELRLGRRDGTYLWVSLRNSVVADTADGPRFLLTHVEDIEERKRHELNLAHRASHDALTGLPNSAELRARLSARLCERPHAVVTTDVEALDAAYGDVDEARASGFPADGFDMRPWGRPVRPPCAFRRTGHGEGRRGEGARGPLLRPGRLQVDQRPLRSSHG